MAKSPATPAPAATPMTTDIATITSDLVLTSSGIPINIHDLPPASISYLLSYGWAKSLQDAAAGATAKAEAAFATGGDEFTKMCAIVGTTPTEALLDSTPSTFGLAYAQALRLARAKRIAEGDMGQRAPSGPRADTETKTMREIARERLAAACRAKAKPMPKGDALTAMIDSILTKYADDIRAEAKRRLASITTSDDIGDLLGL